MEQSQLIWIASFIWGIADNVLRDLYASGKYRDVILAMTVLRQLDVALEPTKQAVLGMKASREKAGITNIAEVLTGELDVRAAAASLRDEAEEPEALDEAEALPEGDEDATDGDLDAAPDEGEA